MLASKGCSACARSQQCLRKIDPPHSNVVNSECGIVSQ